MAASKKKWAKQIKEIVEGEDCEFIDIVQGKNHNKVNIILPGGRPCKMFTGGTPSDSRKGHLNFRNDIRRMINAERENS